MIDLTKLAVWTATNDQNWIAITGRAPFFCLVADSEGAALELAAKALRFYGSALANLERREREPAIPDYVIAKKVLAGELAA
jgi:hypothetical protein